MNTKAKRPRYSEKTINEIVTLYQSGEEVAEINRTYDLAPTTIYHFLKSRGIPTRLKAASNGTVVEVKATKEPEVPGSNFTHGVVTTDKEGFVQRFERSKTLKFELEFRGKLIIEAESLEKAIGKAKERFAVERIFSVKEIV